MPHDSKKDREASLLRGITRGRGPAIWILPKKIKKTVAIHMKEWYNVVNL